MATISGPQLEKGFVEDWGERFRDVWNSHDPDSVIALCTDDVQWSDPALPGSPTTGKETVRNFAAFTFQVFPDFFVEEREAIYTSWTEPMALCPYKMTGKSAGSRDAGIAPSATPMEIDAIDRWTFRDGLLCRYDTYYDHAEMMRQIMGGAAGI